MALQGSFKTISLTDVMALLASSKKSGELRVVCGHVEGRLWIEDGWLVGSRVGKAHGHVDALFELLRLTEGNFVFSDGVEAPAPDEATAVEPLVHEAEQRLREWREIEDVVPSLEHRVALIADLPTHEVTLSAFEWRLVMAIALAGTVRGVLDELALGQFEGCRGIRRLVESGLVTIEPPRIRPSASDPSRLARRSAALHGNAVALNGGGGSPPVVPPLTPVSDPSPVSDDGMTLKRPVSTNGVEARTTASDLLGAAGLSQWATAPEWGGKDPEEAEEDDVRAVHNYSLDEEPQAGESSYRADDDGTDPQSAFARPEEAARQPPESANGSDGDPINRGMLLKFLSSVRS